MKSKLSLNYKLWALNLLILGGAVVASGCGDDDGGAKSCVHGETRSFTCGNDKSGSQPQTCVDGSWYSTSFCANSDGTRHEDDRWGTLENCEDGATRAAVCGEDDKGLQPERCQGGEWVATNACSYGGGGQSNNTPDNNTPDNNTPGNNTPEPNDCTTYEVIETPIETEVSLDGCYKATETIDIRQGGHLTVKPGSIVLFAEGTGMEVDGGKLTAVGESNKGILFAGQNDAPGYWIGIRFAASNSIDNKLAYVTIDGGGADSTFSGVQPANLMLGVWNQDTKVSMSHTTLRNSANWGVYANDRSKFSEFSENTITGNAKGAAVLSASVIGDLDAETDYSGNTKDIVQISDDKVSQSATWPGINVPYLAEKTLTVSGDSTALTIMAGATLQFSENTGLTVSGGTSLTAVGTPEAKIRFEGKDATPGYWRGVRFSGTNLGANKLDHVVIDGGGSEDNFSDVQPANLMLGLWNGTTKLSVTNTTLQNSGKWGLFADARSTFTAFAGNTITGNASGAAQLDAKAVGGLDDTTDYSGNDQDIVMIIGGKLEQSATWPNVGVPYVSKDDIEVKGEGTVLTIDPGATFKFHENKGLEVVAGAAMTAIGEADAKITFEGNDSTSGFWRGIRFGGTIAAGNKLTHVVIDGGGSSDKFADIDPANLGLGQWNRDTTIALQDVTLQNSAGTELFLNGRSTLSSCGGLNIAAADVTGDGAAAAITACGL